MMAPRSCASTVLVRSSCVEQNGPSQLLLQGLRPPTFPARHGDKDLSSCRDQKRTCNSDKNASRIARLYSAPLRPSGRRYHDADGLSISLPARLGGAEIPEVSQQDQLPVPQALARQALNLLAVLLAGCFLREHGAATSPLVAEESIADGR